MITVGPDSYPGRHHSRCEYRNSLAAAELTSGLVLMTR